jgi:hypothetical protein
MLAPKAFLVVQGLTVGLLINTILFLFTGVVLGWGISAPAWYVHIQGKVLFGIMAISVIASPVLFKTAARTRDR